LSQRFRRHAPAAPRSDGPESRSQAFRDALDGLQPEEGSRRLRRRHSLYLDSELVEQLDRAYRELNHRLYPAEVSKSAFLEAVLRYGLDHLDEVRRALA
jgi:hypothetical protein